MVDFHGKNANCSLPGKYTVHPMGIHHGTGDFPFEHLRFFHNTMAGQERPSDLYVNFPSLNVQKVSLNP